MGVKEDSAIRMVDVEGACLSKVLDTDRTRNYIGPGHSDNTFRIQSSDLVRIRMDAQQHPPVPDYSDVWNDLDSICPILDKLRSAELPEESVNALVKGLGLAWGAGSFPAFLAV